MKSLCTVLLAVMLLSSSSQTAEAKDAPTPPPPPYTTVGLEKYAQPGTCQLVGRALVNTITFGPLVFSHQKVILYPLIDYAVWFVKRLAELSKDTTLRYQAELVQFNREAITDADGDFAFNNIACGSYLVEVFTDYENDSHSIENRTVYSTNDDDYPSVATTQRIRTKLRRELDVAAATSFFTRENERMTLQTFSVLGFQKCFEGEL
jgi:hypothetical protein